MRPPTLGLMMALTGIPLWGLAAHAITPLPAVTICLSGPCPAWQAIYDPNSPMSFQFDVAFSTDDQMIYAQGFDGLVAYRAGSGDVAWIRADLDVVAVDPTAAMLIGVDVNWDAADTLHGLNPADGRTVWSTAIEGDVTQTIVSPDGAVVFVQGHTGSDLNQGDMLLEAHQASTGALLWKNVYADPNPDVQDTPRTVLMDRHVVISIGTTGFDETANETYGNDNDWLVRAFNAATGQVTWTALYKGPQEAADDATDATIDHGRLFVSGYSAPGNPCYALDDPAQQLLCWAEGIGTPQPACCTAIVEFDLETGALRQELRLETDGLSWSQLFVDVASGRGYTTVFSDLDRQLRAFDLSSGATIWEVPVSESTGNLKMALDKTSFFHVDYNIGIQVRQIDAGEGVSSTVAEFARPGDLLTVVALDLAADQGRIALAGNLETEEASTHQVYYNAAFNL